MVTMCLHGLRPLPPDAARRPMSPPEVRCMSQLNHDRPVDENETATLTVRTQRMGDAFPSDPTTEEPRLAEVTDLADLTEQAEATARAGMAEYHPIPAV